MIADRLHDRRTHPPRRYFSDLIFEEIITDILHSRASNSNIFELHKKSIRMIMHGFEF